MREKGTLILFVLFLCFLIPFSMKGAVITRDYIISEASAYANHRWVVNETNPKYPIYSVSGREITGEAYSYGNKDNRPTFQSHIDAGYIPRNWKENYDSGHTTGYTGIDCSGLVTRCWGFSEYYVNNTCAAGLYHYTIPVVGEMRKGDLWWSSAHVFLQSEIEGKVYEANPCNDENHSGGNRVQRRNNPYPSYQQRTIFPQFTNPQPPPYSGHVGKEFDVEIDVEGSGEIRNPVVTVNGQEFEAEYNEGHITAHVEFEGLPGKGWGVWMAYHIVVQCDNYVSAVDNYYRDSYDWIVYPDTAPPVVVYTYPHSGEDGVMVDLCEMTIVFSDSMDTSSTNSSISIEDYSGKNIDIKSFEWSEGNTMVGVKIDTLDYLTEYRVTITDDAMSVDSVRLDGDEDGEPGGDYEFTFMTEKPRITMYLTTPSKEVEDKFLDTLKISGRWLKKSLYNLKVLIQPENVPDWDLAFPVKYNHLRDTLILNIPKDSVVDTLFKVRHLSDEEGGINGVINALFKRRSFMGITEEKIVSTEGYFYYNKPDDRNDNHPDENQSPGGVHYLTKWLHMGEDSLLPEIGILLSGWGGWLRSHSREIRDTCSSCYTTIKGVKSLEHGVIRFN